MGLRCTLAPVVCGLAISYACAVCQDLPKTATPATWSPERINAAIVQARKATAEKRFADSESLMLQVTQSDPQFVLPWVELGVAQMGLKKYPEAEASFKAALGVTPDPANGAAPEGFYGAKSKGASSGATTASRWGAMSVTNGEKRTPEILGPTYANLGEVLARENKVPEAQAAFDAAVKALPAESAQYRRNETIVFFQTGHTEAQLAAADEAIPLNPTVALLYFLKGQALVSKSTMDPATQKLLLPPGCADAYKSYLKIDPKGQFAPEVRSVLASAGVGLEK